MSARIKRREFMSLAGGSALAVTLPAIARPQGRTPVIGYLANLSPKATPDLLQSFREGLRERGHVEGKNVRIEYRWAAQMSKAVAAELVAMNVDVIVAWATPSAAAARDATSTIPIVMVGIADPIGAGLVKSLSRPGGNITGTTTLARELGGKLLELLREVVPGVNPVFVMLNPDNPAAKLQLHDVEVAARALNLRIELVEARVADDLEKGFALMTRANAKGVITLADPLLISQSGRIAALAQTARLPVVFSRRENVDSGGLISYGPSLRGQFRDTAVFVDKILKGAKPDDLPVEQPTRFELVVNLKAAKALGLAVPTALLLRADEVIE